MQLLLHLLATTTPIVFVCAPLSAARAPCALPCFSSSAECQQNKRHVRNRLADTSLPPCVETHPVEWWRSRAEVGHRRLWKCLARRRFQLEYCDTVRRSFENPGDADNRFQPQRVGLFELGQHASSLELNIEENGSRKPSAPLSSDCVGQQGIQSDTQTQSQFTFIQSHIDVH